LEDKGEGEGSAKGIYTRITRKNNAYSTWVGYVRHCTPLRSGICYQRGTPSTRHSSSYIMYIPGIAAEGIAIGDVLPRGKAMMKLCGSSLVT
jgi:hypothetical protein